MSRLRAGNNYFSILGINSGRGLSLSLEFDFHDWIPSLFAIRLSISNSLAGGFFSPPGIHFVSVFEVFCHQNAFVIPIQSL